MDKGSFNLQPTLTGELIRLRPLQSDDFENLFACASDPLIWEVHPQPNRYQRDVFLGFFDLAMKSGGALAIIDNITNEIIGSSRFYDVNYERSDVIIGYTFLTRKYWGGRYNRELKTLMLDHAFKYVDSVLFQIGKTNFRSRRAIEKIGAKFVEERHLDGKDHVVYRIQKLGE